MVLFTSVVFDTIDLISLILLIGSYFIVIKLTKKTKDKGIIQNLRFLLYENRTVFLLDR